VHAAGRGREWTCAEPLCRPAAGCDHVINCPTCGRKADPNFSLVARTELRSRYQRHQLPASAGGQRLDVVDGDHERVATGVEGRYQAEPVLGRAQPSFDEGQAGRRCRPGEPDDEGPGRLHLCIRFPHAAQLYFPVTQGEGDLRRLRVRDVNSSRVRSCGCGSPFKRPEEGIGGPQRIAATSFDCIEEPVTVDASARRSVEDRDRGQAAGRPDHRAARRATVGLRRGQMGGMSCRRCGGRRGRANQTAARDRERGNNRGGHR